MAKQALKHGSQAIFSVRDLKEDFIHEEIMTEEQLTQREGTTVTIISLETFTELGDKDFEYYNIKWADGTEETGLSGFHLTPIN